VQGVQGSAQLQLAGLKFVASDHFFSHLSPSSTCSAGPSGRPVRPRSAPSPCRGRRDNQGRPWASAWPALPPVWVPAHTCPPGFPPAGAPRTPGPPARSGRSRMAGRNFLARFSEKGRITRGKTGSATSFHRRPRPLGVNLSAFTLEREAPLPLGGGGLVSPLGETIGGGGFCSLFSGAVTSPLQ